MIKKSALAEVLHLQQNRVEGADLGQTRTLLGALKYAPGFALIVSGIRRCGKSTLLNQFIVKYVKAPYIYLNFDSARLYTFDMNDFNILDELIAESEAKWLFFDEIQIVQGWEMYVRQKLDEGYHVMITGSNASLLSRELGTKLTGRHITKELFPFSFDEFCSYRAVTRDADALLAYLNLGGFPGFLAHENVDIHSALLDDIVYRDIAVRYNIRDVQSLKRLLVFLATNCAKPFSASKLKQYLSIKSTTTVLEYLNYFEASYLIQLVPKFAYAYKVQLVNPRKVYFIDNGLQQTITASFNEDLGRRLENAVFWELRRRGKTLYYFTESGKECDFVVCKGEHIERVIQVCAVLDAENEKREIDGLLEAMRVFGLTEGTIITLNQVDRIAVGDHRISVEPAFSFFSTLEQRLLD